MQEYAIIHDWVTAARRGEKTAWDKVYQYYYPSLYATSLKICKNVQLAQDVVQDAFITAFLKLPQLKEETAFGGWLRKILVHRCYRALRGGRINTSLESIPKETDSWWEDELNRKLDRLSTKSNLYGTIAGLQETLRSTLLLRYFSTFQSYEEIAAILGIPVGTVRSRLSQVRSQLREKWQEEKDADVAILKESEEWNSFYQTTFSGIHHNDDCKNQFINHLESNFKVQHPGGYENNGRKVFEKMIADDQRFGSWLQPANVMSCGNISVIEVSHYNSPEYPHHCPPCSVMVLYRNQQKAGKMDLQPFRQ